MAVRVLVIDDSSSMRDLLRMLLERHERIEVVGAVADAEQGRAEILRHRPDVVLLDIELPRLDGISFLRELMAANPMPVVIVSSLTSGNDARAMEALRAGAVDVISKNQSADRMVAFATVLADKVIAAAGAHPERIALTPETEWSSTPMRASIPSRQVIAIGASTGGTTAVEHILAGLNESSPGVVVALHMPGRVSSQFARRLNDCLALRVKVAEHGDRLMCGTALIGSGDCHTTLRRYSSGFRVALVSGSDTDRVRPSVNRLFNSVAECAGEEAMGIVLTGMGDDGASGLLKMRQAGALTIAEDESSAVVFGMPKAAQALGAAARVLPLQKIHNAIIDFAARRSFTRDRWL